MIEHVDFTHSITQHEGRANSQHSALRLLAFVRTALAAWTVLLQFTLLRLRTVLLVDLFCQLFLICVDVLCVFLVLFLLWSFALSFL